MAILTGFEPVFSPCKAEIKIDKVLLVNYL